MIVGPDAEAISEIVLLEKPTGNAKRPVCTEIDRVLLLCNACEHGACEIDYWIRGEENVIDCKPQSPCCPKCPQWTCATCLPLEAYQRVPLTDDEVRELVMNQFTS